MDVGTVLGSIMGFSDDLFRALDLLGVFINGVLGGMIARRKRFDIVGFAMLAIVSALGGGMLRDTLLQYDTPVALTDPFYLGTALVGALVAYIIRLGGKWWDRSFIVADGLVLGAWAATGAGKTLSVGLGVMPAILLGVTTAVGGGMIRDIAVGKVPAVFGGNTLYATAALAAAASMVVVAGTGHFNVGMIVATVVGCVLSVLARWRDWRLPQHDDWTITIRAEQLRRLRRPRWRRRRDADRNGDGDGEEPTRV